MNCGKVLCVVRANFVAVVLAATVTVWAGIANCVVPKHVKGLLTGADTANLGVAIAREPGFEDLCI